MRKNACTCVYMCIKEREKVIGSVEERIWREYMPQWLALMFWDHDMMEIIALYIRLLQCYRVDI